MSTRPRSTTATVRRRTPLTDHLVRLTLEPEGFVSTGIADEWVGLTVPGQYQSRYYTVRRWDGRDLTLDVVVHEEGLVTQWAQTECVGDVVGLSEPKGSFALPDDATWVVLVGDLTALPAVARIAETCPPGVAVSAYVEAPAGTEAAYPDLDLPGVSWSTAATGESHLAEVVAALTLPREPGYFWMAGESAQMREVRRHLRRDVGFDPKRTDVMGYWSGARGRRTRAVDPGPIYAAGKAAGRTDEEIWADYDAARETR